MKWRDTKDMDACHRQRLSGGRYAADDLLVPGGPARECAGQVHRHAGHADLSCSPHLASSVRHCLRCLRRFRCPPADTGPWMCS